MPSIEGDTRVVILVLEGYYNHINRYLNGWYTSRHDMPGEVNPYSNRIGFLGVRFGVPSYQRTLAHEFHHMIQQMVDGNEDRWVNEGLASFTESHLFASNAIMLRINLFFSQFSKVEHNESGFCSVPLQPVITDQIPSGSEAAYYGAWELFMTYIHERFGLETLQHFARQAENGLAALDTVFEERGFELDVDNIFADWALANFLQDTQLEDGRYGYALLDQFPAGSPPALGFVTQLPAQIQGANFQYATNYYVLNLPKSEQKLPIALELQLPNPYSQDAWIQLVQVMDDQVNLQRFRASEYRGQKIPATLEAGSNYTFIALSPFASSLHDHTDLTDYTLWIHTLDSSGATSVQPEILPAVPTTVHENELIQAAILGDALGVAQQLLSEKLGLQDNDPLVREEALRAAAAAGHGDVVALLTLTELDLLAENADGFTAQEMAAASGQADVLEVLRIAGLPPGIRRDIERPRSRESQEVTTAFLRAARDGDLISLELLLDSIANIDVKDSNSQTALHIAALHGQRNIVMRLLHAGASWALVAGEQSWPPLFYAIENNHTEISSLLIVAGMPLHFSDHSDRTALHIATRQQNADIVRILLAQPDQKTINQEDGSGFTALLDAISFGNLEIVNLLLAAGAEPDRNTSNTLVYAINSVHIEILNRLLASGADPNGGGDGTWTPLHSAAYIGSVEIIRILLDAGADPKLINFNGDTASQIARSRNFHAVAQMLEAAARN